MIWKNGLRNTTNIVVDLNLTKFVTYIMVTIIFMGTKVIVNQIFSGMVG